MSAPAEAPSWAQRLRSWRPVALSLALLAVVAVITSLLASPRPSTTPYAPDNPGANGTMALAALLRDEGVSWHSSRAIPMCRIGPCTIPKQRAGSS